MFLVELLKAVVEKIAQLFAPSPPAPTTPCPADKEQPKIVAVEILDGSNSAALTAKALQYVNLPGEDKWNDGSKLKNKDRQTQRPRVKVRFNKPCSESFKIKLEPGGSNSTYSAAEEGRNSHFKYEKTEKSYTTDADGTKIITDLQIASAGKDTYKYSAKDNYGNQVKSVELETIRRIYIQELKMQGASAATSLSTFIGEFAKHGIELIQLPSKQMDRLENVGTDTSQFVTKARAAYNASGCSARQPYVVAIAYTDHLAVKETPPAITKSNVQVGPGKGAVTIPILVGGQRKSLWKNIVTGESWFISATFRKNGGTAADDVNIPIARVIPVPDNASVPDDCSSVSIQVDGLTPAAETGTITLRVHTVNRMRGGLSFGGGNLICACTRAWWRTISTASQNQVLVHEMGHKIGMVPDGTSLDRTPNQYTGKGHVGSHCHTGLPVQASYSGSTGTCVMFGATHANPAFCADCAKAVKKVDISAGWSAF